MARPVFYLGGAQTDFARNVTREGKGIDSLFREVVTAALMDAKLEAKELFDAGCIHVGNAFGELFTGQAQLGGMPATVLPDLYGVPASRHEGACASGSLALLAAAADIESGRYDVALVAGAEIERNVPGDVAAKYLGAAVHVGEEGATAKYMWPAMFSRIGEAILERGRMDRAHLTAIARKNFANARNNPNAQGRAWTFEETAFDDDDAANPVIEGMIRRQDCGQVTDGAAAILIASSAFANAHATRLGAKLESLPRLLGWGHRTAALSLSAKLEKSRSERYLFPHLRLAITDAYRRAKVEGPWDLAAIETHDCFTVTEFAAIDHLGLTDPGRAFEAIESGACDHGGTLPINPSGGLIGAGHPVGATGVRMALDACKQVMGTAAAMQVMPTKRGPRRVLTLNVGGSMTTVVTAIWGT